MQTKHVLATGLLIVCGAAAFALVRPAQAQDQAEMMAKWAAFKTPGEAHKALDYRAGKWNAQVKMWMAPGAEPIQSTGSSEMKWILEGRYMEDLTNGESFGEPFVGRGLSGYDNLKKKYVSSWIDNMGTCILLSEGTYDAAKKAFTFLGEMPDVMAGKYVKTRSVETVRDQDHWTVQMYSPGPDGKEFLSMEIAYERAK